MTQQPTQTELRECPFCGADAEIYSAVTRGNNADGSLQGHWVVDCTMCNGNIEFCTSEQDALNKWNSRPSMDEANALIDKLVGALGGLAMLDAEPQTEAYRDAYFSAHKALTAAEQWRKKPVSDIFHDAEGRN